METYFISLGEFNKTSYSLGANSHIIWVFFILASFIILVVFMNLLISIMGNTLGDVQMIQTEAQYQEQAEMIVEFNSLIDLKEKFSKMKYIIYISKDVQTNAVRDDVPTLINDFKQQLFQRYDIDTSIGAKKSEGIEKNNRIVLKSLNSIKNQLNTQQTDLKRM